MRASPLEGVEDMYPPVGGELAVKVISAKDEVAVLKAVTEACIWWAERRNIYDLPPTKSPDSKLRGKDWKELPVVERVRAVGVIALNGTGTPSSV
jgi:hypothetical protein